MGITKMGEVCIGRTLLVQQHNGKIWMTWVDDGEGMEVDEAELAEALRKFYDERF